MGVEQENLAAEVPRPCVRPYIQDPGRPAWLDYIMTPDEQKHLFLYVLFMTYEDPSDHLYEL